MLILRPIYLQVQELRFGFCILLSFRQLFMVGFLEYLLIISVQHRYRSFQGNTRYFDLLLLNTIYIFIEHNLYFYFEGDFAGRRKPH